jgi:glycine oxidase
MAVSRLVVIGDGVIGSAIAVAAAARGIAVTRFAPARPGAASPASAGMLAPSVERSDGPGQAFSDAARAAWPRLLASVRELGDPGFALVQHGILQVACSSSDADRLQGALRAQDRWLSPAAARELEPALSPRITGAAHFVADGLADVPSVLASLGRVLHRHPLITNEATDVQRIEFAALEVTVTDHAGRRWSGDACVLAAGAWSAAIDGLPRPLPLTPLRGTLVAVAQPLLRAPIYGPDGHRYLLPRGETTVIGATSANVGFDATPGPTDLGDLLDAGAALLPALAGAAAAAQWTGLRPMTPDRLPILGADPDWPSLLYACGHARNGFLQAALTAEVIADLALGIPRADIAAFAVSRFSPANSS